VGGEKIGTEGAKVYMTFFVTVITGHTQWGNSPSQGWSINLA